MSHTITVRLTREIAEWLEATAARTGLPPNRIVREQPERAASESHPALLPLAVGLTRVMSSVLVEVRPTDPLTLAGVTALFVLLAAGASLVPARRALRVDPMVTLREE